MTAAVHGCWLALVLLFLLTRSSLFAAVFCYPVSPWSSSSASSSASWAKKNRNSIRHFAVIMPPIPRHETTTTTTPTKSNTAVVANGINNAPIPTTTAQRKQNNVVVGHDDDDDTTAATPVLLDEEYVYDDTNVHTVNGVDIKIGPDLNASKPPLDSKLYRQILLPNGMRCVLIQDMTAMRQQQGQVDLLNSEDDDDDEDGDDDDDDDDEEEEKDQAKKDDNEEDEEEVGDDDTGLRDAAAALVVGAGSAYDPLSCQGLAHFLEHLLFMGSEKYPVENEYESYVAKHGGSDNAYTEWEYTCYSLQIPQEFLWGGLDRLAQHFVAPLLLESAVDRELQSIESEFQTNACTSDECRREQLLCATSRLDHDGEDDDATGNANNDASHHRRHYLTKFSWGNLHSLRTIPKMLNVNPLKELRHFFNDHYYGANMRLVVMGAYPLDYMQGKIVDIFATIPALPRNVNDNNNKATTFELPVRPEEIFSWNAKYKSPLAQYGSPLDTKRSLGKIFRIVPIKERHVLTLTWPLLPCWSCPYADWRSKPTDFIAHLIGHEASGSLLSLLRKHDYATDLHAGVGDEGGVECASSHALFTLTVTLSTHGLEHWRQVVNFVYQYIGMLRFYSSSSSSSSNDNHLWPEWIYQELRQMQNMSYRFGDEASPDDTVEGLAESLAPHVQLPPDRLLDGQALLWEFNAAKVKSILDECLTPANARIDLQSSMFAKHVKDHSSNKSENSISSCGTETVVRDLIILSEREDQDIFLLSDNDKDSTDTIPPPQVEPMFGTHFWCSNVPASWIEEWNCLSQPTERSDVVGLQLPQPNPFVPENYNIKKLPEDDAHHVLLNASLKLCIPVGKTKQWFAASVLQYNRRTNALLLSFEDEDAQWHVLDDPNKNDSINSCSITKALANGGIGSYEGTMDGKKTKFRIVSLGGVAGSAVRKFGDASDDDVLDGTKFPPIPPALLPSRLPKEILGGNHNRLRLWHLQDRNFHRPIAELRLEIVLASDGGGDDGVGGGGGGDQALVSPSTSPLTRACAELLVELVWDTCLETAYLASVCDLESAMEATCVGWNLRFHGFEDKLLRLVEMYLNVTGSFRQNNDGVEHTLPKGVDEIRFEACLEVLRRRYRNSGIKASNLASSARVWALRPTGWTDHAKLTAIQNLTIATFMQTIVSMFESSSLTIEALYHGNVDVETAHKAKDLILSSSIMTPMAKSTTAAEAPTKNANGKKKKGQSKKKMIIPPRSILKIPSVLAPSVILLPSREPERVNNAVEVYIQVGKDNVEERVLIDLLVHMMDEPIFDQVRTKEQYGYTVYCEARWSYGIMGFVFGIVSNVKSADQIVERVDQFLRDFRQQLVDMKLEDYLEHQAGLAMQKLDAFDSMSDETDSYWNEITEGRYEWQVWRDEAICLRSITKEQALAAFDTWLRPDQRRRILAVQVVGDGDGGAAAAEGGKSSETLAGGRDEEQVGQVVSDQISMFQKLCKNQTWGRVNSKLF